MGPGCSAHAAAEGSHRAAPSSSHRPYRPDMGAVRVVCAEFVPLRDQSKAQQLQLGREAPASCGLRRAGWAGATRW